MSKAWVTTNTVNVAGCSLRVKEFATGLEIAIWWPTMTFVALGSHTADRPKDCRRTAPSGLGHQYERTSAINPNTSSIT